MAAYPAAPCNILLLLNYIVLYLLIFKSGIRRFVVYPESNSEGASGYRKQVPGYSPCHLYRLCIDMFDFPAQRAVHFGDTAVPSAHHNPRRPGFPRYGQQ
jgi:hypothetical protein